MQAPNPSHLRNRPMSEGLKKGTILDISTRPRTQGGDYVLAGFQDGKDYCDAAQEAWVWSIGKLLEDTDTVMANGDKVILPAGTYLAALNTRFYSEGKSLVHECVWLR